MRLEDLPESVRRRNTPPHVARPWPLPVVDGSHSPQISALLAKLETARLVGEDTSGVIDAFMARSRAVGVPLVEAASDPGSRLVTFLYRGLDADRVYLQANKLIDPFVPAEGALTLIEGTDLAFLTLVMPDDWICSYSYLVAAEPIDPTMRLSASEVRDNRRLVRSDELNPLAAPSGPDDRRSVVALDDAIGEPEVLIKNVWRENEARLTLPASREEVSVIIRSHDQADAGAAAVVLTDGEVWLTDSLHQALAHLIAAGQCPPLHLIYLPSGGAGARQLDYVAGRAEQELMLIRLRGLLEGVQPGWRGLWLPAGQSLGGLFALLAAVRFPHEVAAAVAQSPSLWWPTFPAPQVGPGQWFAELDEAPTCAPCVLQVGATEWVIQEATDHARQSLRDVGRLVTTPNDVVTGGHDLVWWRRSLPGAIALALTSSLG